MGLGPGTRGAVGWALAPGGRVGGPGPGLAGGEWGGVVEIGVLYVVTD